MITVGQAHRLRTLHQAAPSFEFEYCSACEHTSVAVLSVCPDTPPAHLSTSDKQNKRQPPPTPVHIDSIMCERVGMGMRLQVEALLEELQAEPDTAVSLPELTEIIALLLA